MKNKNMKFDLEEVERDCQELKAGLQQLLQQKQQLDTAIVMQRGAIDYTEHFLERQRAKQEKDAEDQKAAHSDDQQINTHAPMEDRETDPVLLASDDADAGAEVDSEPLYDLDKEPA